MQKLNWAFSIAIALSGVLAHAESDRPLGIQDNTVELQELPGQPSRLVFGDGREATLMVSKPSTGTSAIPFKITENNCSPSARAPRCTYNFNVARIQANYLWTKNPDVTRLGQPITIVYGTGGSRNTLKPEDYFYTNYNRTTRKNISNTTPADTIVCDRMDWLPTSQQQSNQVLMKIWAGEFMTDNTETNQNENQAFFSYSDLTWKKDGNTLTLLAIKNASTIMMLPPLTDTSLLVLENQGEECQISSGGSLSALRAGALIPVSPISEIAPPEFRLRNFVNLYFNLQYPLANQNTGVTFQ